MFNIPPIFLRMLNIPQNCFLNNGVLYRLVQNHKLLADPHATHSQILQDAHSKSNFSAQKTAYLIKINYYISNFEKLVQTVIANALLHMSSLAFYPLWREGILKTFLWGTLLWTPIISIFWVHYLVRTNTIIILW